jgi:death-on-curing family protein
MSVSESELILFQSSDELVELNVILDDEMDTVWASGKQMEELFGKTRRTIGEHIQNLYSEGELDESSTRRNFRLVQKEGNRQINRNIEHFNLDVVISVGYRVKSQRGVEFRKWATERLKEHLVRGYTINEGLLKVKQGEIESLRSRIQSLDEQRVLEGERITTGFLNIIKAYSRSFELLNRFDNSTLESVGLTEELIYTINYDEVKSAIGELKANLMEKGEASELFGNEKDDSFIGILGSVSQTAFGQLAYPTVEEQAAQLLYSIIKGHAFNDGNKRIGSFVFVWFLEQNKHRLKKSGVSKIDENTLVALALAVAQSPSEQRELMLELIINLVKN